jgi:hypothetical protein
MRDKCAPDFFAWINDDDEVYHFITSFRSDPQEFMVFLEAIATFNPHTNKIKKKTRKKDYITQFWAHYRKHVKEHEDEYKVLTNSTQLYN